METLYYLESNPILQGVGQYTIELIALISPTLRRGGLEDGIYEVGMEVSGVLRVVEGGVHICSAVTESGIHKA